MSRLLCVLLVTAGILAAGCSPSPEAKAKTNVTKFLAKRLNDPESYKGGAWGELTAVEGCPNVKHYIQHEYRAKNQFGGYVATSDYFLLEDDLEVFSEMSQKDMETVRKLDHFKSASMGEIVRRFVDTQKE